jgi:two-component system, LytTR family, response regulator
MDAPGALNPLTPLPQLSVLASVEAAPSTALLPLRLEVIGSMRVKSGSTVLSTLGGPKAGANQALGLFAFLFDRDVRGLEKDEAIEMIWPEAPLPVADTAFHRTMLGIRRTLSGGGPMETIEFRGGRYFLSDGVVESTDVSDLEDLLDASAVEVDPTRRIAILERCRALNRGAYMDDCPFYGTSTWVEVRRSLVRSVMSAILGELGDLYQAGGHPSLAALRRAEVELVA